VASPEPTDEQLARLVVRVVAAFVALLLAGGIAAASSRLASDADDGAAGVASAEGGDGAGMRSLSSAGGGGGIGPLPGTPIATYVRSRAAALRAVPEGEERAAVVSFSGYRTVAEATAVVASVDGVEAEAVLLALPGGRPVRAAAGVDADDVVAEQRALAASEKAALEELLPSVTDADFRRQYQADIDRLAGLLAGPKDVGAVVHAVVVLGDGASLRRLAARPGVRLVDPGASAAVPGGGGAAVGLRPEETVRTGAPATRPAP
jgi:hypothetical protein